MYVYNELNESGSLESFTVGMYVFFFAVPYLALMAHNFSLRPWIGRNGDELPGQHLLYCPHRVDPRLLLELSSQQ